MLACAYLLTAYGDMVRGEGMGICLPLPTPAPTSPTLTQLLPALVPLPPAPLARPLFPVVGSLLYFARALVVSKSAMGPGDRTAFFAWLNSW